MRGSAASRVKKLVLQLVASYAVIGFGFGMVNAPVSNTAVSGMPRAQAGVAAAVASTSRQVGAALGVAIVGSLIAGGGTRRAFTTDSHAAWGVIAGCGLLVLIIGFVSTSHWAAGTAATIRHLLEQKEDVDGHAVAR